MENHTNPFAPDLVLGDDFVKLFSSDEIINLTKTGRTLLLHIFDNLEANRDHILLDVDQIDLGSGPNHGLSLREARHNFIEFGVCELTMMENVIAESERANFEFKPRIL